MHSASLATMCNALHNAITDRVYWPVDSMDPENKFRILKPLRRTPKDALIFAEALHADKIDALGNPYSLYLKRIAIRAWCNAQKDEDLIYQVACLQSSLFYDECSREQSSHRRLRDEGFSESVIDPVRILTPIPPETFPDYAHRVAASHSVPAISVLIATIEHDAGLPIGLNSLVDGEAGSAVNKTSIISMLKSVLLDITDNT